MVVSKEVRHPSSWAISSVHELAVHALGGEWGEPPTYENPEYVDVSVIRGTEFKAWGNERGITAAHRRIPRSSLARRQLSAGDLVVEVSGGGPTQPVGRVLMIDGKAIANATRPLVCSNFCRQVRLSGRIDPSFVRRALDFAYVCGEVEKFQSNTTNLRNLKFDEFAQGIALKIPPLNEQRRIVAKVEALQARSEAAKQALDAIGPLLERFRQSVLAAAFRGDLTASWREQHPDVEPGSALLERIRVERKARFIAAAGDKARAKAEAKARAAGKSWTKTDATAVLENARGKAEAQYVEPEPVDATGLPELPAGWCWASGKWLFEWSSGKNLPQSDMHHGPFPVYGGNGVSGHHNESNAAMPTIIVGRVGAHCGNAHRSSGPAWITDNAIYSQSTSTYIDIGFAVEYMRSIDVRSRARGGGQPFVSQETLNDIMFPVPPIVEQRKISRQIEDSNLRLGDITSQRSQLLRQLDQLNQSILAKAFRGELVPQDPKDEPASVLLERIRAERTASPTPTKKPKPQRAAPKLALGSKPTPSEPKPEPKPKPTIAPEQLDLLVHVPSERVSVEEEPTEVMAALRRIIGDHTGLPRDAALRILAESLGYQRISPNLRKRLDGHLRAAVRRRIIEPGHAELLRLATHRVEHYSQDELAATLRTISRRGCVYERDELARSLLDHLGFRRMSATAQRAIKQAIDLAIEKGTFEEVESERLRRR